MSNNTLRTDPLFVGLTRPTMILGVSIKFVALNVMITIVSFLIFNNFKLLFIGVLLHGIGYYFSFQEPLFIELITNRLEKCNNIINYFFYKGNSYFL